MVTHKTDCSSCAAAAYSSTAHSASACMARAGGDMQWSRTRQTAQAVLRLHSPQQPTVPLPAEPGLLLAITGLSTTEFSRSNHASSSIRVTAVD